MTKNDTHIFETNETFNIKIPKPSLKYVDFFLSLDCANHLVATGFYPNAKEISETIGVFEAARQHLKLDYRSPDVAVVVVGDGFWPRTATYISYLTRWNVISVDPAMTRDLEATQKKVACVKGLTIVPKRIEECELDLSTATQVVLLFVHSHASLKASLDAMKLGPATQVHAISLPCCFGDDLGLEPTLTYEDPHVLSMKRTMQVYKNLNR